MESNSTDKINRNAPEENQQNTSLKAGDSNYYHRSNDHHSSSSSDSENENGNHSKRKYSRSRSRSNSWNSKRSNNKFKNEEIKTKISTLINEKDPNQIIYPSYEVSLISLSVFNELQANILPNDEISNAYNKYKEKYKNKTLLDFYFDHQNDEWFKEKYDPELCIVYKKQRQEQAKIWQTKFYNWYLEKAETLRLTLKEEDEFNKNYKIVIYTNNEQSTNFEEQERDLSKMTNPANSNLLNIDICKAPYYAFDPIGCSLFIHHLPRNISRCQILDLAKKIPGFINLSLSEPIKNQNYARWCWLTFETEEKCDEAYEWLKNYSINSEYKIHPQKSKSTSVKKIRLTPPLFEERIEEDLNFSKQIIDKFDKDMDIKENNLFTPEFTSLTNENQWDVQWLYLRSVHGFCYYCLKEYEDERNLSSKCDTCHWRNYKRIGKRKENISNPLYKSEVEFDNFFNLQIEDFICNGINKAEIRQIPNPAQDEEIVRWREEYIKKNTIMLSTERYNCRLCEKKFKGAKFIYDHINNKHGASIADSVDKPFLDKIKKENYWNDPKKTFFDKPKIITSMEEYLNSLSDRKKYSHSSGRYYDERNGDKKYNSGNYYRDSAKNREYKWRNRKSYGNNKEYKDLDDVNMKENDSGIKKDGGNLFISYDDL